MEDKITALTELFRNTAVAHHEAYSATDGDDPAWPVWYADFLSERLPEHLGTTPGKEELTDLLVQLDQDVKAGKGGEDWAVYYAESIVSHYP